MREQIYHLMKRTVLGFMRADGQTPRGTTSLAYSVAWKEDLVGFHRLRTT